MSKPTLTEKERTDILAAVIIYKDSFKEFSELQDYYYGLIAKLDTILEDYLEKTK